MQRRDAIKTGFSLVGLLAASSFIYKEYANAKPVLKLRPPAALDEDEFLTRCIRCGLCVEACPFDTLKLAEFKDSGVGIGTPFFTPRDVPCYMCEDIPCVVECPTEALDPKLVTKDGALDINMAKMGVAVVDEKNCVAYFGIQCDACYRACPLIDKALWIDYKRNERTGKHAFLLPIVDSDYCTGCGKCELACITDKAAITVLPRDMVIGEVGDNYVKGWVEGDDAKLKDVDTKMHLDSKKGIKYLNEDEL